MNFKRNASSSDTLEVKPASQFTHLLLTCNHFWAIISCSIYQLKRHAECILHAQWSLSSSYTSNDVVQWCSSTCPNQLQYECIIIVQLTDQGSGSKWLGATRAIDNYSMHHAYINNYIKHEYYNYITFVSSLQCRQLWEAEILPSPRVASNNWVLSFYSTRK